MLARLQLPRSMLAAPTPVAQVRIGQAAGTKPAAAVEAAAEAVVVGANEAVTSAGLCVVY